MAEDTTRIQIYVDSNRLREADSTINRLGLTKSAVINALLARIAATGSIPFSLTLTTEEMAMEKATRLGLTNTGGKILATNAEINAALPEPDNDDLYTDDDFHK
ncbi:type II toxin-antitoxin system RelB/DinJ family antitoxin [Lacticaseibacillus sharpeae]|uniref:DNA-damage-inducible protein J n=1 Tax=Lacticaseibacillus sharpeae JCM 1186 = DSM 20505 TaxID=1291052 RepID=A0A0R1ZRL4_9LACO|nr:type II toxin-antitoxin system RelB/DinJ family antitoxin [Lacticaseibacillus sharpeae]KRM55844.1 hypothetical protein FC18_GL000894 [Lacticaseibacillus sharpeae JCM 1186 = DSM 20505]